MLKKYILILFISLLSFSLNGCSKKYVSDEFIEQNIKEDEIPYWLKSTQNQDDLYLYGQSIEKSKQLSIKASINDAISNLNAKEFDIILSIDNEYKTFFIKNLLNNNIKPNIFEIYVNNYEVLQEQKTNKDYSSMVRIDKKIFIEGLKKQLDLYQDIYTQTIKLSKKKNILDQYLILEKINDKVKEFNDIIFIIQEFDKEFEKDEYIKFLSYINKEFLMIQNELKINIETNDKKKIFENIFIDKIKEENLNISSIEESNIKIKINYEEDVFNIDKEKMLSLTFNIEVSCEDDRSENKIYFREKFINNYEDTLKIIEEKFKKLLKNKNFQKVFIK